MANKEVDQQNKAVILYDGHVSPGPVLLPARLGMLVDGWQVRRLEQDPLKTAGPEIYRQRPCHRLGNRELAWKVWVVAHAVPVP